MPTRMKRHNVCIPDDLIASIEEISERYHMPFSQAMIFLCVKGIEQETRREVPTFRTPVKNPIGQPLSKAANDR